MLYYVYIVTMDSLQTSTVQASHGPDPPGASGWIATSAEDRWNQGLLRTRRPRKRHPRRPRPLKCGAHLKKLKKRSENSHDI